jgi:quercetin dioxygenase-like cupin family protein
MLTITEALRRWDVSALQADTTKHYGVEVRELGLDDRGVHLTHVTIHGELGARIVDTVHEDEHETIFVLEGLVVASIGGVPHPGQSGTVFNIPRGVKHGYTPIARSKVVLLAIYAPSDSDAPEPDFV